MQGETKFSKTSISSLKRILFATEMGTAENFANTLHEEATQKLHLKANVINVEQVTDVKIFNEKIIFI